MQIEVIATKLKKHVAAFVVPATPRGFQADFNLFLGAHKASADSLQSAKKTQLTYTLHPETASVKSANGLLHAGVGAILMRTVRLVEVVGAIPAANQQWVQSGTLLLRLRRISYLVNAQLGWPVHQKCVLTKNELFRTGAYRALIQARLQIHPTTLVPPIISKCQMVSVGRPG
jgi:hypothetical protein